jgi:hypothetical protein
MKNGQDDVSLQDVQRIWSEVAVEPGGKDPNTQALLAGVNFRVDISKAIKAAYLSTKLYLKGKLALASGQVGPLEIGSLGKMLFDVVVASLDAVRESFTYKSTYAACVVLAGFPAGLTPSELESELKAFVEGADAAKLPFYMGFTEKYLTGVRKEIESPHAFEEIQNELIDRKWVTESNGRLIFKERHFTWGATLSS